MKVVKDQNMQVVSKIQNKIILSLENKCETLL